MATPQTIDSSPVEYWHPTPRYDRWLETLDIPIYRDYFIDDLRTLALGPWCDRQSKS
jgi:hypothetical protein